jgi:hypothetical protein
MVIEKWTFFLSDGILTSFCICYLAVTLYRTNHRKKQFSYDTMEAMASMCHVHPLSVANCSPARKPRSNISIVRLIYIYILYRCICMKYHIYVLNSPWLDITVTCYIMLYPFKSNDASWLLTARKGSGETLTVATTIRSTTFL